MDLWLFCEWLIHMSETENDYAADMTLSGISHFLHDAGMRALKDRDYDEYKKYSDLSDKVFAARMSSGSRKREERDKISA